MSSTYSTERVARIITPICIIATQECRKHELPLDGETIFAGNQREAKTSLGTLCNLYENCQSVSFETVGRHQKIKKDQTPGRMRLQKVTESRGARRRLYKSVGQECLASFIANMIFNFVTVGWELKPVR